MSLKSTVEAVLTDQTRSLAWLAGEMERTPDGLRLALMNETLKYSDIKKMVQILKVPITVLFEQGTTVQNQKGNYNNQAARDITVGEPAGIYKRENELLEREIEMLKDQNRQLKDQLADKARIIELMSSK